MRLGFIGLGKHLAEECGLDIEALGKVVRHSDAVMLRKTTAVVDAGLEAVAAGLGVRHPDRRRRKSDNESAAEGDSMLTHTRDELQTLFLGMTGRTAEDSGILSIDQYGEDLIVASAQFDDSIFDRVVSLPALTCSWSSTRWVTW